MRRFVTPGVIAAVAVGLLALLVYGVSHQSDTSSIDALVASGRYPTAPGAEIALPELTAGATRTLADFRGKVVVLNFFASWCEPCAAEAPTLVNEQKLLVKHDATLLGVTYLDNPVSAEQFARRYGVTYPVLQDPGGGFVRDYGTDGVPETFIINRQGKVQALRRYPVTTQWLNQTLAPILAEPS